MILLFTGVLLQATVAAVSEGIVISIIGTITAIVAGYFTYAQAQKTKKIESQQLFINSVLDRVDELETKYDQLTTRLAANVEESDRRVSAVRLEMRKMIDDANFELATWRDKYWTLIEDYQKLKLEYAQLSIKFEQLEKEYATLKAKYDLETQR